MAAEGLSKAAVLPFQYMVSEFVAAYRALQIGCQLQMQMSYEQCMLILPHCFVFYQLAKEGGGGGGGDENS